MITDETPPVDTKKNKVMDTRLSPPFLGESILAKTDTQDFASWARQFQQQRSTKFDRQFENQRRQVIIIHNNNYSDPVAFLENTWLETYRAAILKILACLWWSIINFFFHVNSIKNPAQWVDPVVPRGDMSWLNLWSEGRYSGADFQHGQKCIKMWLQHVLKCLCL